LSALGVGWALAKRAREPLGSLDPSPKLR